MLLSVCQEEHLTVKKTCSSPQSLSIEKSSLSFSDHRKSLNYVKKWETCDVLCIVSYYVFFDGIDVMLHINVADFIVLKRFIQLVLSIT